MGEDLLIVTMLGEFSISAGGETVRIGASRSKVWLLLAYLIFHHGRLVPRDELLRVVGATEGNVDPGNVLRIYRSRARKLLEPIRERVGKELIIGSRGAYGWNPEVKIQLDAERFETLCKTEATDQSVRAKSLLEAMRLYRGEFLTSLGMEPWVGSMAAYFHGLYLEGAEEAIPLLRETGYAQESVNLCRTAIQSSPYHEPLYQELMKGLVALDQPDEALEVYEDLRQLLFSELDVLPSEQTQEIYQQLLRNRENHFVAPEEIRRQLRENSIPTGALICDLATFKLYYRAEARSADRRGDAVHIGLLSLEGKDGGVENRDVDLAMKQLRAKIQESLRIGDIAACCSASQYIVMLVQANYENSRMVLERVIRSFNRAYPRSPVRIRVSVIPLEPMFDVSTETAN